MYFEHLLLVLPGLHLAAPQQHVKRILNFDLLQCSWEDQIDSLGVVLIANRQVGHFR